MRSRSVMALCLALAATPLPALAQSDGDFFRGKVINLVIGYGPGGTYDATARLLARHLSRHIAGQPTIVPQNLIGAGSIKATLYLYQAAPHDGTVLGMIGRNYAIDPLFTPEQSKYDPTRFNPIGSTSSETSIAVSWHTASVKTFDDLMTRELTVGASGLIDGTGRFALLMRNLTGAKIKIVEGYPDGNDITYAMERGEVDGRFSWSWGSIKSRSKPWLDEKKINLLLQMAVTRAPDLPNTPFVMDYAKTEQDRQALELLFAPQTTAWPLVAPPDVPAPRIALLRRAFDETMTDPAFRADAERLNIEVGPVSGGAMQDLAERVSRFDRRVVERVLALTSVR